MSFHLLRFQGSVPAGSAYGALGASGDFMFPPADGGCLTSEPRLIIGAFALGLNLTAARVFTPWTDRVQIRPIAPGGVLPPDRPLISDWMDNPVRWPSQSPLLVEAVHTDAATQPVVALIWVAIGGFERVPGGDIVTIRGDVTGPAATAYSWSPSSITWEYDLPPGEYCVVAGEYIDANSIAHRWIFDEQGARPGAISAAVVSRKAGPANKLGMFGEWGRFAAPVMPRLEVLNSTSTVSGTVFLQVVRL